MQLATTIQTYPIEQGNILHDTKVGEMTPKTIQIFLPDGDPRGVRLAEITSRTVQVTQVPRALLGQATERPELQAVGVYFLVGNPEEADLPRVYVGEAEDCLKRLAQHNQQKDFWQTALVVSSKTGYFTKAHGRYLEWHAHSLIAEAGRYELENTTAPKQPHLSEGVVADLLDNFETAASLLAVLGFRLFEKLGSTDKEKLVVCKGKNAHAVGEYTVDGLIIHKGSTASPHLTKSAGGTWVERIRGKLMESGVLVDDGSMYLFTKDHRFESPSAAAVAVLGRNANGWTEWKYSNGNTLDEVHRIGPS